MSRYIDADALIAWIKESQQMTSKVRAIICKIESMPDIVRCRDCKCWIDNCDEDDDLFRECRWRDDETTDDDDYCSYGERREP